MTTQYWAVSNELKKHCKQHCYGLICKAAHHSNPTYVKKNKFEQEKMESQEKK